MQYNFKFLTGPDGEMCCYYFSEAAEIKKKKKDFKVDFEHL